MKLKHIFYTAAAMAMLSFQACTLDEDTSGISNPDDFFRKFSECQSVVNGCYIPIKSIYTYTYMIATECVTDIAYCPSGTLDASLDISPAVPRMGSTVWRNGYLGVQRCNFAVNGIERARELFGEFQRKYDLVRWGIWYEAVTDNSDYAYLQLNTANSRIKPCHRYYPIPDTEVTYSKNNLDNHEYKAYGL